eukprot:scaffold1204_cov407-Prasinococcus_capsulatus_cf.AAC.17
MNRDVIGCAHRRRTWAVVRHVLRSEIPVADSPDRRRSWSSRQFLGARSYAVCRQRGHRTRCAYKDWLRSRWSGHWSSDGAGGREPFRPEAGHTH